MLKHGMHIVQYTILAASLLAIASCTGDVDIPEFDSVSTHSTYNYTETPEVIHITDGLEQLNLTLETDINDMRESWDVPPLSYDPELVQKAYERLEHFKTSNARNQMLVSLKPNGVTADMDMQITETGGRIFYAYFITEGHISNDLHSRLFQSMEENVKVGRIHERPQFQSFGSYVAQFDNLQYTIIAFHEPQTVNDEHVDIHTLPDDFSLDLGAYHHHLALINEHRANHGLNPLRYDDLLSFHALLKSKDMAVNRYFSHHKFGHPTLRSQHDHFLQEYAYPQSVNFAENITRTKVSDGMSDVDYMTHAFRNFLNSPSHNEAMLRKDFTRVGLGAYKTDDGKWYFTQIFTDIDIE